MPKHLMKRFRKKKDNKSGENSDEDELGEGS